MKRRSFPHDVDKQQPTRYKRKKKWYSTSASFLLHELENKPRNPDGANSLGGYKKVVMIVNNSAAATDL